MLWKCNPEYEILLKLFYRKYGAHAMEKKKYESQIFLYIFFLLQFKIPMENTGIPVVFIILKGQINK